MEQKPKYKYAGNTVSEYMTSFECRSFLYQTCPEAYRKYIVGDIVNASGYFLYVCGLGLEIAGIAINSSARQKQSKLGTKLIFAGFPVLVSGISMVLCVKKIYRKSLQIFNNSCAEVKKVQSASLSLSISPSNAGFTFQF